MMRINKILRNLVLFVSLFYILLFLYVSISRIGYPFELEWMEGGSVDHMERVMEGKSIYTPPSIEFIPYIYTPLYYYSAIPLTTFTGINLLPLRLVSFISTLLLFVTIFFFIKRSTDSNFYAITAVGLFAASYSIGGAWYDLARVDMLYILFMMLSIYILRFHKTKSGFILAAVIAGLSFLTKQTAVIVFAPIGLYLLLRERGLSWYFNILFTLIAVLSTLFYTISTDGWYYFWNFTLPSDHRWNLKFLVQFWTDDIIKPYSIAVLLLLVFLIKAKKDSFNEFLFYALTLVGIVASTWSSRLHYGGYSNVLIPLYLFLCIFAVLGFWELKAILSKKNERKSAVPLIYTALLFQFIMLFYSPRYHLPAQGEEKAGWALVDKIKSYKGDVYVAGNVYLARLAGKKVYAHKLLIRDLTESSTKYNRQIEKEYHNALKSHKFDAVIDFKQMNDTSLTQFYKISSLTFEDPDIFWMRTGFITRPAHIYEPKK